MMSLDGILRIATVNGHIESKYSTKTGKWTTPKFVEDPFLRIHGMAPGLNYGMCLTCQLKRHNLAKINRNAVL